MLDKAVDGAAYNKAAMIRNAQDIYWMNQNQPDAPTALDARSRGSIEAKLMNASAAHRDIDPDATTMDCYGYRALSNYQAALKQAMTEEIAARRTTLLRQQAMGHASPCGNSL
jgi:hypothetical protein